MKKPCRSRNAFGLVPFSTALLLGAIFPGPAAQAAADLDFTLTITPPSALVGETVKYELRIRNLGPDATQSSQFTVTTQLGPDLFAPESIESTAGACTLGAAGENYRCVYPRFQPNDEVLVTIIGKAIAAGTRLFFAGFTPADDPNSGNNLRNARLTVQDPAFCTNCLVGTVTCEEPGARRLDADCQLNSRFTDVWEFELDRPGTVSIELRMPLEALPAIRVRDSGCREVPPGPCRFETSGVTCPFQLQAGRHFILAGARVAGSDYELAVECGGVSAVACLPDSAGGVEVSWRNSPLTDPAVPISIQVNGREAASVPGTETRAALSAADLGQLPDGAAELCVTDSSGRPACCGIFLGDDLAVNCGGPRLDPALGTGIGDGRVWLEDSAAAPSPFLRSSGSATLDFAAGPGGFTAADLRLVEPDFTDDPARSRLFATARTAGEALTYRFGVRPGTWEVTLLFAEGCCSQGCLAIPDPAESPGPCRVFEVRLNGSVVESRFSPHVVAQLALRGQLPNQAYGVALAGRPLRVPEAREIEVSLRDLGAGEPPGDPLLQGIFLRRVRPARFAFTLAGAPCGGTIQERAGTPFRTILECRLTTTENPFAAGARAWSLSLGIEGGSIAAITTAGTAAAAATGDPPGLRDGGFELSEVTSGAGNEGAVSAVVLSLARAVTLPPGGTAAIARVEVEGLFPPSGCSQRVTVFYADGRSGARGPVENLVEQLDLSARPALGRCAFELQGLAPVPFRRADPNDDGEVDISDAIAILLHLFVRSFPLSCRDVADIDDDGEVGITDPIRLLEFLFLSGRRPAAPFAACGPDPTVDILDCERHEPCPPLPPGGGDCPPPSAGPILVRAAPEPFQFPLLKGLPGQSRLTVRNPRSRPLRVDAVAIDPRFDDELFRLASAPALPLELRSGEPLGVDIAGASRRLGLHRVDVRYRTDLGDHVEEVLFEVAARGARPQIPEELLILTLPGQPAEGKLAIANGAGASADLIVGLDGPAQVGLFSVDPALFPIALPPGGSLALPVRLQFDPAAPGAFGEVFAAELRLRSNGSGAGGELTGEAHRVQLLARVERGASFSGPLAILLGGDLTRALVAGAAFRSARFTVRTADPRFVRFRDGAGNLVDELRGVRDGEAVTFAGVGPGVAEIAIGLEPGEAGGGQFLGLARRVELGLGKERAASAAGTRVARLLDGGKDKSDLVEFIDLPGGALVRRHELPGEALLRGSDLVPVEIGGRALGLFQLSSGETRIYDFADGREVAAVGSPGAGAVSGVEPAVARITVAGQERAFGISVDSRANLNAYDVESGAVSGAAALADSSPSPALGIGEDVDLLVHGQDGTAIPPALFVMTLNGECFAATLPGLETVTPLGQLPAGVRVAVDPVAAGPAVVTFQDAAGEVLFVDRSGGGLRTYRRLPRIEGEVLFDAPLAEVDLAWTPDGGFGVQLAAFGHAFVLDREKIDPLGARAAQELITLPAPFEARSLIGVDPRIARYDPASPTREQDARVICAYERDVVRIFSLDGSLQFTFEPLSTDAEGWERNIDVLVGPPGAGGLEEHVILRYGEGEIRVVELATGRILHTIAEPDRRRPVEGVDPRLTPDGRFLIDLSEDPDQKRAVVRIHGVHPETFGERREVEGGLALPERDVDLVVHESGQWAALLDGSGGITVFDLEGRVLSQVPGPGGGKAVNGVDLGIAREAALTPDPDEDWVEPAAGEEPTPNPPPQLPPTPGPITVIPGARDGQPGNFTDFKLTGGGGCVIPGGSRCVCDGKTVDLNALLAEGIPELDDCPVGFVGFPSLKTSVAEVKSHSPIEECTTRRLQAIKYQGKLIPVGEVELFPADDCPVPDCGCEEDHWHAANGADALATDGTRVPDPNPSRCGYGTVSEVEVVDLGEETDCTGKVVAIEGDRLKTLAPGTAVIHIRPCVDPGISAADLLNTKPIEVEIVVIRPRKLTAELQAPPRTVKMVDKSSEKPECLAAACGDLVFFTAETCPPRCVGLLKLGQSGGTLTGPCKFIEHEFQGEGGTDSFTFPVEEDQQNPAECRVHSAVLRCKERSPYELQPINLHVVDIHSIMGPTPPVLTQGDGYFFSVRFCALSGNCRSDECVLDDLRAQVEAVAGRAEYSIVEPDGTEVPLGNPPKAITFDGPGEKELVVDVLAIAPDLPGEGYKFRAKLGSCSKEIDFKVAFRSVEHAIPSREQPDPGNQTSDGDPVFVHSGEHVQQAVDLVVPGRGPPFLWERVHRSQATYRGPLGNNWDFRYNERLEFVDEDGDGDLDVRHSSMLYLTTYLRTGDGPLDYLVPDGHYKRLRRNPDGSFSLRFRDGEVHTFHGPGGPLSGRLKETADRTGENRLRFEYDAQAQLATIFDTYNRPYTLSYERGRITRLRDFGGREVVYEYYGPGEAGGSDGDLKSARSPVVTGTPNGNDFPQGKKTVYTYLAGPVHPELRSNLLTVTLPNEVARGGPPSVINTYGTEPDDPLTFDRVITQVEGGTNHTGIPAGGTYQYYYEDLNAGADPEDLTIQRRQTVVVDRNGNVRAHLFNSRFQLLEERIYTGRVSPLVRFPHAIEARGPGLRADFVAAEGRPGPDPDFYTHRYELNRHGEVIRQTLPEGNRHERVYGFEDDLNPLVRGDLTEERWVAEPDRMAPGPGDATVRRRTFTYEPLTNTLASMVEYRGHDPAHDGPDADQAPDGPDRYRIAWLFDFQEITDVQRVRDEAASWGIAIPADFSLGLGDLNGDGREGPLYGQPVKEIRPAATVLQWDGQVLVSGPPQEASALLRYDRFGLVVSETDLEENVSEYLYYPSTDPDGDGRDLIPGNDPQTGGYLRSVIRDTASAPGRNSGRNPPPENRATHFRYNPFGFMTEMIDGRGVVTALVLNQLDQVVRTIQAESIDLGVRGALRPEESLVAPLGYVVDVFYDHNDNLIRIATENQGSGTEGTNPTFDLDMEYDIRKNLVRRSAEVDESTRAVWEYRYDPNENEVLLRQPEGNETRTVHDERDLVLSVTVGADDPAIASTTIKAYDGNGNLRFLIDGEDTDGDGFPEVTESFYDGWDRPRRVINPAGHEVLTDYDASDQPVRSRVLGSLGGPTPRRGDGAEKALLQDLRSAFDERGRRIRADSMLFGPFTPGLETVEGPLTPGGGDVSTVFEHDRLSRQVRSVDDRGNDVRRGYNGLGETILRETAAVGGQRNSIRIFRDRAGNPFRRLETEVRTAGGTEEFENVILHDAVNRLVRITDPLGQTSYMAYDSRGNLTVASDAKGRLIGRDPTGATDLVINSTGNTRRSITDGLGRVAARFTDLRPGGQGDGSPSFDSQPDPAATPAGLEGTPANPDGVIAERFIYDRNSRLIAYQDDRGATTRFSYDSLDRLTLQEHADGSRWTFRYDRDSNLRAIEDPRGVVTRFSYDALERHVRTDIDRSTAPEVGGTLVVTQEFDGLGRVTRLTNENDPADPSDDHAVEWEYDSIDNPLREAQDGLAVERQWDGVGNRLATVYPGAGRTLAASYDALDRCEALELQGALALDLCRTEYAGPSLRRIREQLGNGLETLYLYDPKRRLQSIETKSGAATVTGRAYAHDRADNRISERWLERLVQGGQEGRTYALDSRNRFTAARPAVLDAAEGVVAQAPLGESFLWVLDGAGNWVEYQTPERARAGQFNLLNQDVAQGHDGSGNRTADDRRRYVFDGLSRLIAVHDAASGALLESYTYDGLNRRVTRAVMESDGSRTLTRFLFDSDQVIEERVGETVAARNYYLPMHIDGLVARETPAAGLTWLHADIANSTTAVTDAAGLVLERCEYAPFGEPRFLGPDFRPLLDAGGRPLRESSIGNPYLFTGRRLDRTGLYYFRARYLDPEHGRFLSRDFELDPLHGGNLYSYAGLNPLVYIDPWGTLGFDPAGVWDGVEAVKGIGEGILEFGWDVGYTAFLPGRLLLDPKGTVKEVADFWKGARGGLGGFIEDPAGTYGNVLRRARTMSYRKWGRGLGYTAASLAPIPTPGTMIAGALANKALNTLSRLIRSRAAATASHAAASAAHAAAAGAKGAGRPPRPHPTPGGHPYGGPCFLAGTPVETPGGPRAIETLRVGERVVTRETADAPASPAVDERWRILEIIVADRKLPGRFYQVTLLRPPEWLALYHDTEQGLARVDFSELGITGWGRVASVKAAQRSPGEGRLITATTANLSTDLHQVRFSGSGEALGATARHPFYSLDRREWVPARSLRPGERVATRTGGATVESVRRLPGEYRVYNLEIEGTHTYFVGICGALVHNPDLALGLGAGEGREGYVAWARRHGWNTYSELGTKGDLYSQIERAMQKAVESGSTIHFNLRDLDFRRPSGYVEKFALRNAKYITNWELETVMKKYPDKVRFWLDDVQIPKGFNPFKLDPNVRVLGQDPPSLSCRSP